LHTASAGDDLPHGAILCQVPDLPDGAALRAGVRTDLRAGVPLPADVLPMEAPVV
jgi:hypothetical protein